MNRSAERMAVRGEGLRVIGQRLSGSTSSETSTLHRLIQDSVRTASGGMGAGGAMTLYRGMEQRPLQLLVSPLGSHEQLLSHDRAVAAVFATDPDRVPEPPSEVLVRLYGLTPAESRLASHLATGIGLLEAAKVLGISHNTARNQLKQVFAKTGTHRQADLVRLLLSNPPMFAAGTSATDDEP